MLLRVSSQFAKMARLLRAVGLLVGLALAAAATTQRDPLVVAGSGHTVGFGELKVRE